MKNIIKIVILTLSLLTYKNHIYACTNTIYCSGDFSIDVKPEDKNIAFTEQRVPQIVYWVVLNDDIIGIVKVRKRINENLKKLGGHIGYYILKKYRNKGYGKELLKRALDLFDDNTTIVITCSKDNLASQKVIEYNNGILIEILNDRCIYNIEK